MRFVNRQLELAELAHFLESGRPELVILYGRRGIGKSSLVAEALAGRAHFYYQATTRALPQQLEDLTAALRTFAPEAVLPGTVSSPEALLDALVQIAVARTGTPVIAVIDELPYMAEVDPALPTVLQRWWDGVRARGILNLKVFLLGSMVTWMEEQTLSERGPLYNRRTGQLRVDPLGYREAALFYPDYGPEDRIAGFAIWGGMPSYLESIAPERSLWENVRETVLRPGARLADEPSWLRFSDLRNDALYGSVLRAIAQGAHRPGKIARAVGRSRADDVAFPLSRLCDLRLVERVVPVHERHWASSRQALYLLADHYLAFWYRFVDRLRHLLALRRNDEALDRIKEDFDQYVSRWAFEDVCRQFLWQAAATGRLPKDLRFDETGSWWTAKEEVQDEIDVVAMQGGRAVLVGECKWSLQPVGARDLEGLTAALRRAHDDLEPLDRPWRALFSRSGFEPELGQRAEDPAERLLLLRPDDLYW